MSNHFDDYQTYLYTWALNLTYQVRIFLPSFRILSITKVPHKKHEMFRSRLYKKSTINPTLLWREKEKAAARKRRLVIVCAL